jgi:hypothetical protein
VAQEGKAFRFRQGRPGEGGEGAVATLRARHGVPRLRAEQPGRDRRRVGVDHHGVGRDELAGRERDAGGAAVLHADFRRFRAVAEDGAAALRERFHRAGQPVHPALDEPDTFLLDVGDQHQGRGREEGRGAAVCGVAAEELAQARVPEVLAQGAPERGEG